MSKHESYYQQLPNEGTWSVFAEKVVAERDKLSEELSETRDKLRVCEEFCSLAEKRAAEFYETAREANIREDRAVVERDEVQKKLEDLEDLQRNFDTSLRAVRAERDRLHAILRDVLKEVGAFASPAVSIDFLSHAPQEVRLVVRDLRDKLSNTQAARDTEWFSVIERSHGYAVALNCLEEINRGDNSRR